jgi:hypothetical protein
MKNERIKEEAESQSQEFKAVPTSLLLDFLLFIQYSPSFCFLSRSFAFPLSIH